MRLSYSFFSFFFFLFFFFSFVTAELNIGEDNTLARGVHIVSPDPPALLDTNATTGCSGGQVLFGNGSCGTIAGSGGVGDFSFTDFQASFNLNITDGFVNYTTSQWHNGLFNWTINPLSAIYLIFNGNELTLNETRLNETISDLDTNETNRLQNLTSYPCAADEFITGFQLNATPICAPVTFNYNQTNLNGSLWTLVNEGLFTDRNINVSNLTHTHFFVNVSSSRVGVGTANPRAPLDVILSGNSFVPNSGTTFLLQNSIDTDSSNFLQMVSGDDGQSVLAFGIESLALHGRIIYNPDEDGDVSSNLRFFVNENEIVRFRELNVGINDTSPDYRLEIVGSNGNGFFGVTDIADGDIFEIDSNGNVGIGTASPGSTLHISASASGVTPASGDALFIEKSGSTVLAVATASTSSAFITFPDPSSDIAGFISYNHITDDMSFFTGGGGTLAMTLDNSQRVGIGLSDPAEELEVNGQLLVGNGAGAATLSDLMISGTSSATEYSLSISNTVNRFLKLGVNQSDFSYISYDDADGLQFGELANVNTLFSGFIPRMTIDSSGNVGIGTSTPTHDLNVIDDINVTDDLFVGDRLSNQQGNAFMSWSPNQVRFFIAGDQQMKYVSNGANWNENSLSNLDFRMESDLNTHMFFMDASTNRVGIGDSSPDTALDVVGDISLTGEVIPDNDCGITGSTVQGAESGSLNGGEEWSYGDGSSSVHGVAQPCPGVVEALTLYCRTSGTSLARIQMIVNGTAAGAGCEVPSTGVADGTSIDTSCAISFGAFDTVGFNTSTGDLVTQNCVATAFLRYD